MKIEFLISTTRNQKLLLPSGPVTESSESGALTLSSAARHIDFHLLRLIYVAFRSAFHTAYTTLM